VKLRTSGCKELTKFCCRYCDCFANGEFCNGCNCCSCANNLDHEEDRLRAIHSCLERNPLAFHPKIGWLLLRQLVLWDDAVVGHVLMFVSHETSLSSNGANFLQID
jgi:hypothetical protein